MKWLMFCLPFMACSPTCEQQGGKWVQEGYYYVWQWIDVAKGIGYQQMFPNYVCKKEKNA